MHAPLGSWLPIKTDFLMRRCICLSPVPSRYLQGPVFLQLQRTADENMPHKKRSSSICPRLLSLISIIVLISTPQTLASQMSEQPCQVLPLWQPRTFKTKKFFFLLCLVCLGMGPGGAGKRWGFAKGFLMEFAEITWPSRAPLGRELCAGC